MNFENIGVSAFGLKTGIITFDDNINDVVKNYFKKNKNLLDDKDILCITEAVVAITQKNYISVDDITKEIQQKLNINQNSTIGIIYPILSRNRFSMILKAIAKTVNKGKVIVQLKFPDDEQGNPIVSNKFLKENSKKFDSLITLNDLGTDRLKHPETGVDYIDYYTQIIEKEGASAEIFLANSTRYLIEKNPDGIIISNVHHRFDTYDALKNRDYNNVITLQDIYNDTSREVYSEYGLLGSNILDIENQTLKLAPRNGDKVVNDVKQMIKKEFNKDIEVIIFGDGAYKDPESGIYELADPVSAFGVTPLIKNRNREGIKTKYLMQKLYSKGKSKKEILDYIILEKQKKIESHKKDNISSEGTTPRKIENLVSSLADLVSGSADANTPIVLVKNFIDKNL